MRVGTEVRVLQSVLFCFCFPGFSNYVFSFFLKEKAFSRCVEKNPHFYDSHPSGRWLHYINTGSLSTRYLLGDGFITLFQLFLTVLTGFCITASVSFSLSLIFFLWTLFFIPFSIFISRRSVSFVKDCLKTTAQISETAHDALSNFDVIHSFLNQNYEKHYFKKRLKLEESVYLKS